jgi:formylmethanofuran dehydrogenase subunit B
VIWIYGFERVKGQLKRNAISVKDVHKMLTAKLDDLRTQINVAKHPLYFLLYMKSGGQPAYKKVSLEQFFKKMPL